MKNPFKAYTGKFSENKFWQKLKHYAKQAGLKTVYVALLLFHAYKRKDTPSWAKHTILGALGYFLSPIDAIPDLTPILGYTDDIGVLTFGLVTVAAYVNDDVRQKAKTQLSKWFGTYDEEDLQEIDAKL